VKDAKAIREHNRSKEHLEAVKKATSHVSGSDAARSWKCSTCNVEMSAEAAIVNAHNSSHEHERLARLAAEEQGRDGSFLAAQQRMINGDKNVERTQKRKRSGSK
jgi:hypothetical protein